MTSTPGKLIYNQKTVHTRNFRTLAHNYLMERRKAGFSVSPTHSEHHLNATADLVEIIGKIYGFTKREIILGKFAGQFHDIVRDPREDLEGRNERSSADISVAVLAELSDKGQFSTIEEERKAVEYAVLHHGDPPSFFEDPKIREQTPDKLKDKIHTLLYVADGLQRLGASLIQRRSAFVGGERRLEGDLRDMRFRDKKIDAVDAILLESAVRLGWKDVEDNYPDRLESFIKPAFKIQRYWVAGLLASRGLTLYTWADMLWETRNEKRMNIFELSKLPDLPRSTNEIEKILKNKGKMTMELIKEVNQNHDLMHSSMEAALYFSSYYKRDSQKAIKAWHPTEEYARLWKKEM